jgi:hypothetical protein
MKNLYFIYVLLVLTLLSSCKGKEEQTEKATKEPEVFEVGFNLTFSKDDVFQLYYTEDGSLNFNDEMSIRLPQKGSENSQEVVFKMPNNVLPTNIRLDLGENPEQKSIVVNSMRLKFYDNVFEAKDSLVSRYFYLLENQVKYDNKSSVISIVTPEGVFYDPLMWSNELLTDEIKKVIEK